MAGQGVTLGDRAPLGPQRDRRENNNLEVDRLHLGLAGLKKEPIDNDFPTIERTPTAEFDSQTALGDLYRLSPRG